MRIITLGTSHGNHTPGRFVSSTLLEIGERCYLIDAGEPASAQMFRAGIPFKNLRAVFITHMHDDHTSGLSALVKALHKYPVEGQHTDFYFAEEAAIVPFCGWLGACHVTNTEGLVHYHATKEGFVFKDENITVTAIPTRHMSGGQPAISHPTFPISRKTWVISMSVYVKVRTISQSLLCPSYRKLISKS